VGPNIRWRHVEAIFLREIVAIPGIALESRANRKLFRIRRLVVGGRDFFGHLPVLASFADKCPAGFCVVIHPDEIAV
jgi:hypothetical protein